MLFFGRLGAGQAVREVCDWGRYKAADGRGSQARVRKKLLLVIHADQHADEFSRDLAMVFIQSLQIGN